MHLPKLNRGSGGTYVAAACAAFIVLALGCSISIPANAQHAVEPTSIVRYHLGDDSDGKLHWADPNFDDSSWHIAQNGFVPSRAQDVDRFVWVRIRVAVPANLNGPLALHLDDLGVQPKSWQVFVNGLSLGGQGTFPPDADPADPPISPVFSLPPSLAPPGSVAVIALREWHAAAFLESRVPTRPRAVIDGMRALTLAVQAAADEALLANGPVYLLSTLLALAGIALLVFWRASGGREYLWAAIMLLTPLANAILSTGPFAARLSFHTVTLAWTAVYAAGLIAEIEFLWALSGLRSRWLRTVWHIIWIAFLVAEVSQTYLMESRSSQRIYQFVIDAGIPAFDCILFPVCIREMIRPGGNRAIAAAQSLFEVIVLFGIFGYSIHLSLGPFSLDIWNLSVILLDMAIAAMLFQRGWKAWKESSSLRAELEAAREVQEQLVTPAVNLPGFQIESAYLPAKQVGGDFFRVLPGDDGSVLIIAGDVSGKGLKAAMTVSAIMGALRGCESRRPAEVLEYLNRVLVGQISGFVTCSVALISAEGLMTLANAGNPAPYRNGEEMPVAPGLPLGMITLASYEEAHCQIAPGDRLTFVSDGVIEATSPTGELYGFDRTAAISTQPASGIAQAAQAFGQEDDITVLTVTRVPAENVLRKGTTSQLAEKLD